MQVPPDGEQRHRQPDAPARRARLRLEQGEQHREEREREQRDAGHRDRGQRADERNAADRERRPARALATDSPGERAEPDRRRRAPARRRARAPRRVPGRDPRTGALPPPARCASPRWAPSRTGSTRGGARARSRARAARARARRFRSPRAPRRAPARPATPRQPDRDSAAWPRAILSERSNGQARSHGCVLLVISVI